MCACMYVLYSLSQAFVNLKYGKLASLPLDRQGVIQERVPERLWVKGVVRPDSPQAIKLST